MPERVNTSPLASFAAPDSAESPQPAMVRVDHVSMVFNMANEQLNSLKEYAIALARRELMFKEFRALDDVSFEVKKGDVFGILGTNGSGKSTMLKIIAGVLEPTEGSCSINGNIAPLIELGAGFDMELTARENIYLNGALLGYSRKFIKQHFDEIVEFAEIEKFLDMPMKNYSSGMVARIAFAIATVIVPEILIVDEVLSVGDFMFQQKCERRITKLIKDHDVTVLIVSHNNDQIERLCNKAIWIEKGHTRMLGSAHDVCRTYRVLGGHVGSAEAERQVFEMLNAVIAVPDGMIDAVSGESRYGTAARLMEKCAFPPGGTVIIAPGEQATVCLGATGLAGLLDAPLLLTKPDSLPDATAQELKQAAPRRVVVIGDARLMASRVIDGIKEACGSETDIVRIEGDTPARISWEIYAFGKSQGAWGNTAFVSYVECTGDLVSLSPSLFKEKAPVFFLVSNGVLDERVASALQAGEFEQLFILGGKERISHEFLAVCEQRGTKTGRIIGKNPYHANEIINDRIIPDAFGEGALSLDHLLVTSAWEPFDALAAGVYAGKTGAAFLLEDPQDLDSVAHALSYLAEKNGAVKRLTFLGDATRFSTLDKFMLGKAAAKALEERPEA